MPIISPHTGRKGNALRESLTQHASGGRSWRRVIASAFAVLLAAASCALNSPITTRDQAAGVNCSFEHSHPLATSGLHSSTGFLTVRRRSAATGRSGDTGGTIGNIAGAGDQSERRRAGWSVHAAGERRFGRDNTVLRAKPASADRHSDRCSTAGGACGECVAADPSDAEIPRCERTVPICPVAQRRSDVQPADRSLCALHRAHQACGHSCTGPTCPTTSRHA